MADDIYERFGDILHEMPEIEGALRDWRNKQAQGILTQRIRARRSEILVKCYGGTPDTENAKD